MVAPNDLSQALTPDPTAKLFQGAAIPQPKPAVPAPAAVPKLDLSKYKVDANDPSADQSKWGKREGGSNKGMGFLGLLKNSLGGVSSELSIGVEMNGKEIEIPTLVPTLNQQEVDWLLANPKFEPSKLPESIKNKAVQHATMRIEQGLSPFVD